MNGISLEMYIQLSRSASNNSGIKEMKEKERIFVQKFAQKKSVRAVQIEYIIINFILLLCCKT